MKDIPGDLGVGDGVLFFLGAGIAGSGSGLGCLPWTFRCPLPDLWPFAVAFLIQSSASRPPVVRTGFFSRPPQARAPARSGRPEAPGSGASRHALGPFGAARAHPMARPDRAPAPGPAADSRHLCLSAGDLAGRLGLPDLTLMRFAQGRLMLSSCKRRGIQTARDSNGTNRPRIVIMRRSRRAPAQARHSFTHAQRRCIGIQMAQAHHAQIPSHTRPGTAFLTRAQRRCIGIQTA